jgi:PAS domain S-box-containing protein
LQVDIVVSGQRYDFNLRISTLPDLLFAGFAALYCAMTGSAVVAPQPTIYGLMETIYLESGSDLQDLRAIYAALDSAQAIIEFDLNGNILHANDNFPSVTGYTGDELAGRHHSMFCERALIDSPAYARFWQELAAGKAERAEYKRIAKGGREFGIDASYNPVRDDSGKVCKVIKFATDIACEKMRAAETKGLMLEQASVERAEAERRKVDCLPEQVARAARGDLTGAIDTAGDEPLDQLARGVMKMIGDLREVIGDAVSAAGKLNDSSRTIADRSNTVAASAQALGATVEEMNASVDGLTASINTIARSTQDANGLAQATRNEAEIGCTLSRRSVDRFEQDYPALFRKYLRPVAGGFAFGADVTGHVTFGEHNLLQRPPRAGWFDLVMLRNVLIYFDHENQERVLAGAHAAMRPDARLVLGEQESITRLQTAFAFEQAHVYRIGGEK